MARRNRKAKTTTTTAKKGSGALATQQGVVLGMVIAAVFVAAVFWFFTRPNTTNLTDLRAQVTASEADLRAKRAELDALGAGPVGGGQELYDRVVAADALFPAPATNPTEERLDLIERIPALLSGSGLVVSGFNQATAGSGDPSYLAYTVSVLGSLDQIVDGVTALQGADRLMTIHQASLTAGDSGYHLSFEVRIWQSATPPLIAPEPGPVGADDPSQSASAGGVAAETPEDTTTTTTP